MADGEDLLQGETVQLRSGVTLQVCYQAGQAPVLVFLHGGLGNRFNWRSQYEYFQAQDQAVLAYDLAGHGQSSPYRRYSIGRHCRDLSRLLQQLQIHNPVLCCHSYGVPIGLEWARTHPVQGLVLIGGGTHDLDPWWEIPLMKFLTWGGRHFYRLRPVREITQQLSSSHRHETIQQFFAESPVPTHADAYRALEIFWGYNFFKRGQIHRVTDLPALIISGGQDPMFTSAMAAELAAHFRTAEHLHVPGAGHLVMAECPELINRQIAQWLSLQLHLSSLT